MAKKRGKSAKATSKKIIKRAKSVKKFAERPSESAKPMKENLRQLEILGEEKNIGNEIEGVEEKEEAIEKQETAIAGEEKKIEGETEKVEKLEREIKKETSVKPLEKFSLRDLNKVIVGAFIGVVAHFGFIYAKIIKDYISFPRAILLFVFSYLLIIMLMYETGYREIREKRLLGILPRRATLVYISSLIVIIVIFFLFNLIDLSKLDELFKEIAVTSVLASVGAGTADLIGRN